MLSNLENVNIYNEENLLFKFNKCARVRVVDINKVECWESTRSVLIGIFLPNVSDKLKKKVLNLSNDMISKLLELNVIGGVECEKI